MIKDSLTTGFVENPGQISMIKGFFAKWISSEKLMLFALLALTLVTWKPRLKGPIDLRWDGGVYYILGTSLAEGKGYKLLNEPGEISANQYPPLLPLIIAAHQLVLRTSDPTVVGTWLRYTSFLVSLAFILAIFQLFKRYLPPKYAFIGARLCPLTVNVYFLSDLCFPEILFSLSTILFFIYNGKENNRRASIAAYIFAVAAYALRTVGLALLLAWVLESLLQKKFKQAFLRFALILLPVLCWQLYVGSVEKSEGYNHPAYSYQRAPSMFYNVSYARNVALEDPFAPEKGKADIVARIAYNAVRVPYKIGETLLGTPFWADELERRYKLGKQTFKIMVGFEDAALVVTGLVTVAGLLMMMLRKPVIIPVYVSITLATICLVPFLGQFTRYIMPVLPFLILALILFLVTIKNEIIRTWPARWHPYAKYIVIVPVIFALFEQTCKLGVIKLMEHQLIEYVDKKNIQQKYRVFFADTFTHFNACVQYIRDHAQATDVVASSSPHWIYLQTGLKAVMPPFEINDSLAQQQLESVPVKFLVIGSDVLSMERYTLPVVQHFAGQWKKVFTSRGNHWTVYQRMN